MSKSFSLFINFDGNCQEAVTFYAKVFQSEVKDLMTYDQMPPDPNYIVPDSDKKHVMYCAVPIFETMVMFSDVPSDMPLTKGDNISPTLSTDNKDEIHRIFAEFAQEGTIVMELNQTFWSELYGMVQDKYGIIWQLSYSDKE